MQESLEMLKWRRQNLRTLKDEHQFNLRHGVGSRIAHELIIAQVEFEIRELSKQIKEQESEQQQGNTG